MGFGRLYKHLVILLRCLQMDAIYQPQVIAVCALCALAIPIKLWMIRRYGIEAMIISFVITYLLVNFSCYGLIFKKDFIRALT